MPDLKLPATDEKRSLPHSEPKATRTRKNKATSAPDYLAQFDLIESPHMSQMTTAWLRLYAAVASSIKK